jgi:hypothetical protein
MQILKQVTSTRIAGWAARRRSSSALWHRTRGGGQRRGRLGLVFRSLGRQLRERDRVGEGRAERRAVRRSFVVFAVQHEQPLDCDRVRAEEGCRGARFSSRRSGPTGRGVDNGDEEESNASSRARSVNLLFISRWRLFARGCPKIEV